MPLMSHCTKLVQVVQFRHLPLATCHLDVRRSIGVLSACLWLLSCASLCLQISSSMLPGLRI